MKIKKMTATFGNLERATLTLGEGLTVLTAPNEGGKSTWSAFLRVMFYGIDTKDRDKAGYLADKNRYQPWSGAPMSGEIQLEWEGRDITIRRSSTRSTPMGQFQAVYTATGDPVPELTGTNVGEKILGVNREVFVRTAFVGQNNTVVTKSAELERRVAALATSGEEDVSAGATQRVLRDWRNRRQSNRAKGLIPELESELQSIRQTLRELERARNDGQEARREVEALSERQRELEGEREIHRKLAAQELNRRCGEALAQMEEAERQLAEYPAPDPVFRGMTVSEAREMTERLRRQAEEARRRKEQGAACEDLLYRQKRLNTWRILLALLGVIGLAAVVFGFAVKVYLAAFVGIAVVIAAAAAAVVIGSESGRIGKQVSRLRAEAAAVEVPEIPNVDAYAQWLAQRESLQREVRYSRDRYEDLIAQGAQPLNTLEMLHKPSRSASETAAQLSAVERELSAWQSRLDRAIGALRLDPLALEARCGELETQLEQRTAEYRAIDMAADALEHAESALRERFSPALNQTAAEILSAMTGGKYEQLTLSREFEAMVGGGDVHSALYLSAGTMDQLYLSVRLALCRLTVPGVPVLLDDALCAFDDRRVALAMDALREMGKERQILLFTCQSREGRWADEHGVPSLNI